MRIKSPKIFDKYSDFSRKNAIFVGEKIEFNMHFIDLSISQPLVAKLESQGILAPTMIQQLVIPAVLRDESVVAKSQTGSGKTLAYLLPLIQMLGHEGKVDCGARVLILVPTRELVQQICRVCEWLTCDSNTRCVAIYGGVGYDTQHEAMGQNPDVLVATPGRLQDLIEQGKVSLASVKRVVFDEVDQMVDMGFRDPIMTLTALCVARQQTLCFSATLPVEVTQMLNSIAGVYDVVEDKSQPLAAQQINQSAYFVEQSFMGALLLHLMRMCAPNRTIVFCRSRKMADSLNKLLLESKFSSEAIHSDRSQAAREYILQRFKDGETKVLVATDLLARGIDVMEVSHVFNFGLPQNPEQYIHRIGRTGRAGHVGEAISLLCPDEQKLLGETCAMMRQAIPVMMSHPYMTPAVTLALSGEKSRKKRR